MIKLDDIKQALEDAESARDLHDVAKDAIRELDKALKVVEAARVAAANESLFEHSSAQYGKYGDALEAALKEYDEP